MVVRPRQLCGIALFALLRGVSGGAAQATADNPPLAWATVSIHVKDPEARGQYFTHDEPDGITNRDVSLRELISEGYAFSVMPFRKEEIAGLPGWAQDTRYDVVARVDPEDVPAFKKLSNLSMADTVAAFAARQPTGEMLMMQSLLRERFHLQAHWESKERTVYALVVAKGGVRMTPAADPKHGSMSFDKGHIAGKGVPISFLATLLALPADRTVVDRTGLTGQYDFDLHFEPTDSATGTETNDPDFFTGVQDQLGLKLESTHAAVPVLVVDHVEPPTPN